MSESWIERLSPCGVDLSRCCCDGIWRVSRRELISGCHIVPKHATVDDLGSLASHRRTASACIPIMYQLLRMRSNCTVGKDPRGPLVLWFPPSPPHYPALGTPPSPPAYFLHDPSAATSQQPHPTSRSTPTPCHSTHIVPQKLAHPLTTSAGFHIPRAAGTG